MKKRTIIKAYSVTKVIDESSFRHESFGGTILVLKENALKQNVVLNDKDIAAAIEITADQYQSHLKTDKAPPELFKLMRSVFENYLLGLEVYNVEFTVTHPDPLSDRPRNKRRKK